MNGRILKRLSALTLIGLMMAGNTAYAQYGNEIELRGVRSRCFEPVANFIYVSLTTPSFEDFAVLAEEHQYSEIDGLLYSEAMLSVVGPDGSVTTTQTDGSTTTTDSEGSPLGGIAIVADLRTGREIFEANLFLPIGLSDISDVFTGLSNRASFLVLAEGEELGRVQLERVDLDEDGLHDGVRETYTDAATGVVSESIVEFRFNPE